MMTASTTSAPAKAPAAPAPSFQTQIHDVVVNLTGWFQSHWLQIIIAAMVAAAIVSVLYALRGLGNRLCRPDRPSGSWTAIAGKVVSKTTSLFIIMVAVRLVSGYAAPPEAIADLVGFLFTVAVVLQGAIWARELVLGFIEHRTSADHYHGHAVVNAMGLIRLLISVVVFAIAIVVLLDNLGVNVTGLVAGLGIGGIAIGLAAQGIFADLFAALAIIFDRPFSKGDSVSYDTTSGTIEEIGLKSTRIRSFTGEERIISNRNLLDKEILNNTLRDHRRHTFIIGLTYQTAPEVCASIPEMMQAIVAAHDALFVRCGFINFGASSLDFELIFDTPGPDYASFYETRTSIGLDILAKLNAEHIDIAYPTQTTFTADPAGRMIMPYPEMQPVKRVDGNET
jgi:small-conductance mechanosensitive channel